ncbi:MAG: long-chain fatty acid--CoA ligase [Myxococcota bacterium]
MSGDAGRAEIEAELLAWMAEPEDAPDDERFDRLARALFAFQFEHCAAYGRFCRGRGVTPSSLRAWHEIPTVPTGAFKELVLTSFPPERTVKVFRTSGTSTRSRGALHLDTLALYEASLLPSFRRHLLPDLPRGARARLVVMTPSPQEVPDSSLSHMFGVALRELGDAGSRFTVRGDALDVPATLAALDHEGPVLLCGTAFAFVHLLDALAAEGRTLALSPRTRLMETGGFKGRARERSRETLHAEIEERLGVPPERVVNQYGMTELASQFHDSVLSRPGAPRHKVGPPWARVRRVHPQSGEAVAGDEIGVIQVFDLANTGSVLAVQTADLGRAVGPGFEVLGREPGAEERGCSIAADELLGTGGVGR